MLSSEPELGDDDREECRYRSGDFEVDDVVGMVDEIWLICFCRASC